MPPLLRDRSGRALARLRAILFVFGLALAVVAGRGVLGRVALVAAHPVIEHPMVHEGTTSGSRVSKAHAPVRHSRHACWRVDDDDDDDDDGDDTFAVSFFGWNDLVASPVVIMPSVPEIVPTGIAQGAPPPRALVPTDPPSLHEARGPPTIARAA